METPLKEKLIAAAEEYRKRQTRQHHPDGHFDNALRWWPSNQEHRDCCSVRSPTRAHPNSLNVHCRTVKHLAQLFAVDENLLRRITRNPDPVLIAHTVATMENQ